MPQNLYPNKFSSDPNSSLGTLHGSVDSEISLHYQTSVSREEDSALQNKPSTAELEWSKQLRTLEEEELAERVALYKRMREVRKKLEIENNESCHPGMRNYVQKTGNKTPTGGVTMSRGKAFKERKGL